MMPPEILGEKTMNATSPQEPDAQVPDELRSSVEHVLELIRPAVQADGGDFDLIDVRPDGVVEIRFKAACVDCPSRASTLHGGIERNLKNLVPGVTAVVAID